MRFLPRNWQASIERRPEKSCADLANSAADFGNNVAFFDDELAAITVALGHEAEII